MENAKISKSLKRHLNLSKSKNDIINTIKSIPEVETLMFDNWLLMNIGCSILNFTSSKYVKNNLFDPKKITIEIMVEIFKDHTTNIEVSKKMWDINYNFLVESGKIKKDSLLKRVLNVIIGFFL